MNGRVSEDERRKRAVAVILIASTVLVLEVSYIMMHYIGQDFNTSRLSVSPWYNTTSIVSSWYNITSFEEMILKAVDPMSVRKFAVALATNPLETFPELWSSNVLVSEEKHVSRGYYWAIRVELDRYDYVNGSLSSTAPIDFYVMSEDDYELFREKGSFYYTILSRKAVYSSSFEWRVPVKGTYYFIVSASYGDARVKLMIVKSLKPLTENFVWLIDDRDAWYIWIVNVWVAKNIRYVKDPGFELFQKPSETLELKAGDCDDVAILLASMYQALGLQTKFIEVDTDGDRVIDHLAVLVRYPRSPKEFLNAEEEIAEAVGLGSRLPDIISVKYLEIKGDTWIIVDPFASESDYCVGMIKHEPYVIIHYFP